MNFYDQIYEAAKSQDKAKIEKILEKGCIDEWKTGTEGWTAAAQLAFEGDEKSAEWLRANYDANVNYIALGAARGGHEEYAELLRTEYDADPDFIAQGAARGGHKEYAELLRNKYGADPNLIAKGAAQGGYIEYAKYLLEKCGANKNFIAKGLGQSGSSIGRAETVEAQLKCNFDWKSFAMGAAHAGEINAVNEFLQRAIDNPQIKIKDLWLSISERFAQSGHIDYAKTFRTDHNSWISCIALFAAWGGHRAEAEELRIKEKAGINCVAGGALQGGHIKYLDWLFNKFKKNIAVQNAFSRTTNKSLLTLNIKTSRQALLLLSLSKHDKCREVVYNHCKKLFPSAFNVPYNNFIKKVKIIRRIRENNLEDKTGLNLWQLLYFAQSSNLRTWILFFDTSCSSLFPLEIRIKICSFLTEASEKDIFELRNKMCFYLYKQLILQGTYADNNDKVSRLSTLCWSQNNKGLEIHPIKKEKHVDNKIVLFWRALCCICCGCVIESDEELESPLLETDNELECLKTQVEECKSAKEIIGVLKEKKLMNHANAESRELIERNLRRFRLFDNPQLPIQLTPTTSETPNFTPNL